GEAQVDQRWSVDEERVVRESRRGDRQRVADRIELQLRAPVARAQLVRENRRQLAVEEERDVLRPHLRFEARKDRAADRRNLTRIVGEVITAGQDALAEQLEFLIELEREDRAVRVGGQHF